MKKLLDLSSVTTIESGRAKASPKKHGTSKIQNGLPVVLLNDAGDPKMKIPVKTLVGGLLLAVCAAAHPMGNFSVSHYSRLDFKATGLRLTYVLDLAEIPTLEVLQQWQTDGRDEIQLQRNAAAQAGTWLKNLSISVGGRQFVPRLGEVKAKTMDGAGGMLVLRVWMSADVGAAPGQLSFEDRNYANRTGWKEIVLRGGEGVALAGTSHSDRDISHELTQYPSDPTLAPPQDLAAFARWSATDALSERRISGQGPGKLDGAAKPDGNGPAVSAGHGRSPASSDFHAAVKPIPVASPTVGPALTGATLAGSASANVPAARTFAEQQSAAPGSVVRGDFLSVMLRDRKFGLGSILLGLLVAFSLGAMHALSPGHGKTIVAAYLVGSRGTLKHALFLGSMVTFTHTISVFLLGLGVLFFQKYVVPEQIIPVLGTASGFSIVCIGSWLLYRRSKALMGTGVAGHAHAHDHDQHRHAGGHRHHNHHPDHDHHHHQHPEAEHVHASHHAPQPASLRVNPSVAVEAGGALQMAINPHREDDHPFVHTHTHDGHTHSHSMPDSGLTLGGLIALGASGGLVPCPSALILLLSATALGHTALGLGLLAAFSTGLALVLMGIGALVLFAKHLLPAPESARNHPLFRLVPVFSSVVVIVLGLLMTLAAMGWIRPIRALGT
jgi:ABC-type nickel/cobalt efflux system permease component RcnA